MKSAYQYISKMCTTLPCEIYLFIEGRVTKKDGVAGTKVPFINNLMSLLFEEIRYKISGIIVESIKRVRSDQHIKALISL